MKKVKYIVGFLILLAAFFTISSPVLAQYGLQETGQAAGITGTRDIPSIVALLINVLLSLIGVGFLVLLIYAGILYLTAQGDTKPVEQAKGMIKSAVIGLIIVLAAYAITNFVMSRIVTPISGSTSGSTNSSPYQMLNP